MVEQSPDKSMQNAFLASLKASTIDTLLRHVDVDVKVTVASCITDLIWLLEIHSQLENYATQKRTPNSTTPKQNLKIIHFFSKQSKEGQQKFININHLLRKIVCLTVQKKCHNHFLVRIYSSHELKKYLRYRRQLSVEEYSFLSFSLHLLFLPLLLFRSTTLRDVPIIIPGNAYFLRH